LVAWHKRFTLPFHTFVMKMDIGTDGIINSSTALIAEQFPINSLQQLTLQTNEVVTGRVYCSDEATRTVVLQKSLTYTTLSSEIRIISVRNIVQSKLLMEPEAGANGSDTTDDDVVAARATPLTQPLPIIQKKVLEERERRSIRLAEESLRHINPKVRPFCVSYIRAVLFSYCVLLPYSYDKALPIGQAVFERLLKACGEVYWKEDTTSILVLNHIQVDEPYKPENCSIVTSLNNGSGGGSLSNSSYRRNNSSGGLEDGSLDRVKKIVASALLGSDTASMGASISGSNEL
jgi:Anticodon-binding domain